ncbi:hypothetical protein OXB_1110 [Bacillus sp. OxB-1]|nr:hypothetical protein OXB_1110 [Bacillus sp. OxB-1]
MGLFDGVTVTKTTWDLFRIVLEGVNDWNQSPIPGSIRLTFLFKRFVRSVHYTNRDLGFYAKEVACCADG